MFRKHLIKKEKKIFFFSSKKIKKNKFFCFEKVFLNEF